MLIDWAFQDTATSAVIADCSAQNTASISTLEKLGFVHERTIRERLHWRRSRRA